MRPVIFKSAQLLLFSFILIYFTGCAGIEPLTPEEILKHPLGNTDLRVGMTKDEIADNWGEPDLKEYDDTGKWGNARERWTYHGRYNELPADVGYLSKTHYLYFDGKYLVKFEPSE